MPIRVRFNWQNFSDKLKYIIAAVLCGGFFLSAVGCVLLSPTLTPYMAVPLAALFAGVGGILFWRYFLGDILEAFFYRVGGGGKLDKPPLVTGHIDGLLAARKYVEAEAELLRMAGVYPCDPRLTRLLMELYTVGLPNDARVWGVAGEFFAGGGRVAGDENLEILFRACDAGSKLGYYEGVAALLERELRCKARYRDSELRQMAMRLEAVRGRL